MKRERAGQKAMKRVRRKAGKEVRGGVGRVTEATTRAVRAPRLHGEQAEAWERVAGVLVHAWAMRRRAA